MLQVKNLSYEVVENGQKLKIIDDISFDVADGELLVITGPNGGGKSTMASLLMGIKPQTSGQIILDGEDITGYDIDHRAKAGLGFAFQQPPRFKGMTVKHLIQLSSGDELSEDESCQLLSNVGLCAREYLERQVDSSLSGGEMKRIEIATAFSRHINSVFLMNRKQESTSGVFRCLFSSLKRFIKRKKRVSSLFPIRNASFRWLTVSWSSAMDGFSRLEQKRKLCRCCLRVTAMPDVNT